MYTLGQLALDWTGNVRQRVAAQLLFNKMSVNPTWFKMVALTATVKKLVTDAQNGITVPFVWVVRPWVGNEPGVMDGITSPNIRRICLRR